MTDEEVIRVALDFIGAMPAYPLPVAPAALCERAGVKLRTVSEFAAASGMAREDIYAVLGNRDGAAFLAPDGERCILFNDAAAKNRLRFTLCEELAHLLLGHPRDPGFRLFAQSYDEADYARAEEEAKAAACLLLCPPGYYLRRRPGIRELMRRCRVSDACAGKITEFYAAHGEALSAALQSSPHRFVRYR